jgi:hypothetical protein
VEVLFSAPAGAGGRGTGRMHQAGKAAPDIVPTVATGRAFETAQIVVPREDLVLTRRFVCIIELRQHDWTRTLRAIRLFLATALAVPYQRQPSHPSAGSHIVSLDNCMHKHRWAIARSRDYSLTEPAPIAVAFD